MSEYRITENLTFKEAWDACKADATARMTHPGWDGFWTRISPDAEINVIDATRNDWRVRIPVKEYNLLEVMGMPIGTVVEANGVEHAEITLYGDRKRLTCLSTGRDLLIDSHWASARAKYRVVSK